MDYFLSWSNDFLFENDERNKTGLKCEPQNKDSCQKSIACKRYNQCTLKCFLEFLAIVTSLKTPNNEIPNPMIPKIQLYNTMQRWIILIKLSNHLIFVTESSCISKRETNTHYK